MRMQALPTAPTFSWSAIFLTRADALLPLVACTPHDFAVADAEHVDEAEQIRAHTRPLIPALGDWSVLRLGQWIDWGAPCRICWRHSGN
jgi:hypothetical protein